MHSGLVLCLRRGCGCKTTSGQLLQVNERCVAAFQLATSRACAEAKEALKQAITVYTDMGRLGMAARHIKVGRILTHRIWNAEQTVVAVIKLLWCCG